MKLKNIGIFLMLSLVLFMIIAPVSALSIAVHVPEKYTDVYAGERFYFEVEVKYPENTVRKDLRLNYEILKGSKIIAQSQVLKAIETQASFMDYIVIPESADSGIHTIKVKISDYKGLSEEVSATFHVTSTGSGEARTYFLILLGAIAIVGGLLAFEICYLARFEKRVRK